MKIISKPNYTLLVSEENSVALFYQAFSAAFNQFKSTHLIVQLNKSLKTTATEIMLFLTAATTQKQHGFSFVIVADNIDIDGFPDNFNIVPTLTEAEDVLEMEAIERDLGF